MIKHPREAAMVAAVACIAWVLLGVASQLGRDDTKTVAPQATVQTSTD